jgi:GTPase SAR1 family protein
MKVVVLGDNRVGKSTWVYSLLGFDKKPARTLGVEVFDYTYNGKKLTIWDTANTGLYEGYILGADYAVIVYKNKASVEKYKEDISRYLGKNIPCVAFNISDIASPEEPLEGLFA